MGRLLLLGICLCIFLFVKGGQETYTAVTNMSPTEITFDEYMKTNPPGFWFKLKDCTLVIPAASYMTKSGAMTEAYVPLYGSKPSGTDVVKMVFATKDPEVLNLLQTMKSMSDDKIKEAIIEHPDSWFKKRDIEGVVRYGMDLKEKDRNDMRRLNPKLDAQFIILTDGDKPSLLLGLAMLAGGFGVAVIMLNSRKVA